METYCLANWITLEHLVFSFSLDLYRFGSRLYFIILSLTEKGFILRYEKIFCFVANNTSVEKLIQIVDKINIISCVTSTI